MEIDENGSIGDLILQAADEINADLIVAGAWGHKRLREMIFGGVTRELISNQITPVLLSH